MPSSKPILGVNDLQSQFPKLAQEWHPTKNGALKPTEVTTGSSKKVWWKCNNFAQHEWESVIHTRTNGIGCPICSGKKVLTGFNDLETLEPLIAKEWHPTKNRGLKATDVTRGSKQRVWWQCSDYTDHEWETPVNSRTNEKTNCPICAGKKVLEGFNDLVTTNPEVAKEWHPVKNLTLRPNEVVKGSSKKVWWQCKEHPDHEWESTVASRTQGTGCPICAGKKVLKGFNDLESTEPEIAKEWHPTKNGNLKPYQFTKGSHQQIWWRCSEYSDHEWDCQIKNRVDGRTGCPICANKKVLKGFNDLQTVNPRLAEEWHHSKNEKLNATDITISSGVKVWWQCKEHPDHEWESTVASRTDGRGCPICAGKIVLKGFNDLATTNPEIAKEWHPVKNVNLRPNEVTKGSSKIVWWQCTKDPDHEWDAPILNRTNGHNCPFCAEYGFNPLNDAWFYLMERPGEQQLGITNNLTTRMRTHRRNGWVLLEHSEPSKGQKVFDTEAAFKKWLKKEIGLMEGTTENWSTTSMEVKSLAELKARSGIETDIF